MYAVLEHMTLSERLATIEAAWAQLRPGGVLVVFDTPNRLFFVDFHTSLLPFFHTLPDALALRTATQSPRAEFREAMRSADEVALARWGRGVSFHEFETVLGDLSALVVADGFDPVILSLMPTTPLENLLREVFVLTGVKAPIGFSRASVDVILQKPDPARTEVLRPDPPPAVLMAHATEARARELEGTLRSIESSVWYRSLTAARRVPGFELAQAAARSLDAVLKGKLRGFRSR
jgi:S-adenosylmethionine-dependent methyltransferase